MSTLKVNKLRDTAGSADAIPLDPNGGAVLAGVTTVSTVKVGSGVTISSDGAVFTTGITTSSTVIVGSGVTITESGIEASGIGITCANINGTQIGGRRNIIINGAFNVAQRGTSSTSTGYKTVDRFRFSYGGTAEAPTQPQVDLSSSDTPYSLGFRKSYKITNGNQTSGADAGDYIAFYTALEAQDLANSGWNYTSTSSNITLSFWAKSSVAKTFIVKFTTIDGTQQAYNHSFTLSANTWTKVTHTLPGAADIQFDNNVNNGLEIQWDMYSGTTYTSGSTVNQWVAYNGYTSTPDQTSDWYTTNDATFEITGVQLEVGSVATPFEHRSVADSMLRCKRYFQPFIQYAEYVSGGTGNLGFPYTAFTVPMRASPTFVSDHESKSSNWSFTSMQVQGSAAYGYYAYAISYNTTNSNYGYMRKYGKASAEL